MFYLTGLGLDPTTADPNGTPALDLMKDDIAKVYERLTKFVKENSDMPVELAIKDTLKLASSALTSDDYKLMATYW